MTVQSRRAYTGGSGGTKSTKVEMTFQVFEIAGRKIGPNEPPYVIAELSGNHNGDIDRALALVDAAKEAGADAVKLQTYTADTITIDHDGPGFVIKGGLWDGRKLYQLYQEAHTPFAWHRPIVEHARKRGITVFSSPFDPTAVDFLENLAVPAYKIASFELVDLPLVRKVARCGKPLIMSTGMANETEIRDAIETARQAGAHSILLLHCVSGYPAPITDVNLRTLPDLARRFDVLAGLSDHTMGIGVAAAAVALGACVIEKHITLRRADGGPDAAFSLEPHDFASMVTACREAWGALGHVTYECKESEKGNVQFRRSLYVVADMKVDEPFSELNVRSIRPGFGMPPRDLDWVIGRRAAKAITRGTPLSPDLIS